MNSGRTTVNLRGRPRGLTGGVAVILALVTGVQGTAHAAVSPTPTKTHELRGSRRSTTWSCSTAAG